MAKALKANVVKKFKTELLKDPDGSTVTGINIPFDIEAVWGAKRVPVKGTINKAPFRSTVVRMGGEYCMVVNKELREASGAKGGEIINVVMQPDTEERTVIVPDDLVKALKKNKAAAERWEKLSYTHRKEYVNALLDAKKPETRVRRLEQTIVALAAGIKKK